MHPAAEALAARRVSVSHVARNDDRETSATHGEATIQPISEERQRRNRTRRSHITQDQGRHMFARCSGRAGRHVLPAASQVIERLRARAISAFVRYLTEPTNAFGTLTTSDLRALAGVLDRGDVLLSAGNTRCAALVKRVTRSSWSHVSMYVGPLDDAPDPLCIVEADIAGGVRTIRLSQLDAHRVCVLRPSVLDDAERRRLADSVLSRIGSEYDLRYAWMLALGLLLRRWRARLTSIPAAMGQGATRFICSSLIAQAFALIGHSILPVEPSRSRADTVNHSYLTPADFERAPVFEAVWSINMADESS